MNNNVTEQNTIISKYNWTFTLLTKSNRTYSNRTYLELHNFVSWTIMPEPLLPEQHENSVPRSGHPLTIFTPLSKPQLIQAMNSEGCNNFLTPRRILSRYPNHNDPSHNWSKPWILKDVIISSNPWWLSSLDPNHNWE